MNKNTTASQDDEIRRAKNEDHISNLIAIIGELDARISEWQDAAQCDEPGELIEKLAMTSS